MVVDTLRLEQACERGHLAPLYLLFGEEDFLMAEAVHRLEEAAERCPFPTRERLMGRDVVARDLIESACTLPLGGGFRLLIVEEAQGIAAAERDKLLAYVEDPCPSTCLVFAWRAKTLDGRDKLVAALKRRSEVLEFTKLRPGELKTWARVRVKAMGLAAEPGVIEALIEGSGGTLRDLAAELDKAALSAHDGRLAVADLAALSRHGAQTVWRLAELACGGEGGAALAALADVLEAGGEPSGVLKPLARHLRKVLLAAELSAQGTSDRDMAARLKTFPIYVAGYVRQARLGRERLVAMLAAVLAAEFDIKTGAAPERERLERLVLALAERPRVTERPRAAEPA